MDRVPSEIIYKIFDNITDTKTRLNLASVNVRMCVVYNVYRNRYYRPYGYRDEPRRCFCEFKEVEKILSYKDPKQIGQRRMLLGQRAFKGRGMDKYSIPHFPYPSAILYVACYFKDLELIAKLVFDPGVHYVPQHAAIKKYFNALVEKYPKYKTFFEKQILARPPPPYQPGGFGADTARFATFPLSGERARLPSRILEKK